MDAPLPKSGHYTTVANDKMNPPVEKEKQSCPHCAKKVIHLKQHIRNMHAVAPPPPPTPEPELVVVEIVPEPVIVALPPSPPPEKETFAAVAAKVTPPLVAYTPPMFPLYRAPVPGRDSSSVDATRVVNNLFKFTYGACPGRKAEWMLLVALWKDTPERFQISKQHISAGNTVPRITVTVWRDEAHISYAQYHIYMNPSAFATATHIDGHESGISYRLVEFMGKL